MLIIEIHKLNFSKIDAVFKHPLLACILMLILKTIFMKKKLLTLLLISGFALSVSAQEKVREKDVPAAIQTSFKNDYPNAGDADWKIKDGHYKAEFRVNGTRQIASYDASGKMLSKGIEIKENELPAPVKSAVQSDYAARSIDDVYKVDKDGTICYLVKLNGSPETKIFYSADGKIIKDKMNK
jgi:hypothetical protein